MEEADGYLKKPTSRSCVGERGLFTNRLLYCSLGIVFAAYILNRTHSTGIVEISQGKVQGFVSYSRHGRPFSEFWGIPYAQPPVGKLRFQSPVPAHNWTGVRIADQTGIECLQMEFIFTSRIMGEEDCLYLNVFTPQDLDVPSPMKQELFPVVVFIHGGGFMAGSTKLYTADYLMDEDIVLVTLNYRLGALGFLNSGDRAVLGNMGLKDQNLALKWIQDNIHSFGGDPSKVTLMGESAGSASVHLHVLSPLSEGLFQRAISLSGTGITHWAFVEDHITQAKRFAKKLNCDNSSDLLECLQNLDGKEIVKLHYINRHSMSHPLEAYAATVENVITKDTFLSREPQEIFSTGDYTAVPWLTGVNEAEGLLWYARILVDQDQSKQIKKISNWYRNMPRYLALKDLSEENAQKITKYYFNEDKDFNPIDRITNMTNLFGDRMFHMSYNEAIKHYQNRTNNNNIVRRSQSSLPPLYLYYFTYRGFFDMFKMISSVPTGSFFPAEMFGGYAYIRDFIKTILGMTVESLPACHANELALIFDFRYIFTIRPTSRDFAVSAELIKMIANFSSGNDRTMQFHGRHWSPVRPDSEANFMRIDSPERSGLIPAPFAERLKFWENLRN